MSGIITETGACIHIKIPKNLTSEQAAEITKRIFDGYHDFDAKQKFKVNTEEKSEKKIVRPKFRFEVSTFDIFGCLFPSIKIYKDEGLKDKRFMGHFTFTEGISDLNSFLEKFRDE